MDISQIVKNIKCFLLDMDGTLYFDDEPIGEMSRTLDKIRESGRQIVYFTNNSSKSLEIYEKKLRKLNFFKGNDFVYTSGLATIEYLKTNYQDKKIYLLGTSSLKEEFINNGINLSEDGEVVVVAYDTELTYEKLCQAVRLIDKGAIYIATHPDINCPAKDCFLPDVGSFIKLIEASTGKLPEIICGKPYSVMGECIKKKLNMSDKCIAMVGDRLCTDIAFGNNSRFTSILVFSGETTEKDLKASDIKPTFCLPSLNDIVKYL